VRRQLCVRDYASHPLRPLVFSNLAGRGAQDHRGLFGWRGIKAEAVRFDEDDECGQPDPLITINKSVVLDQAQLSEAPTVGTVASGS
jgi:hypothetical protein